MTNDFLHASIAAALVQANLAFTTVVGEVGTRSVRLFELSFGLKNGRDCKVTGYVAGAVLISLTPVRIRVAKRLEISDALTLRMPMVRLFPPITEPQDDHVVVWIETSVPVPALAGVQTTATAAQLPMPPWLAIPAFMNAVAAADYVLVAFPDDASIPAEPLLAPILEVDPNVPQGGWVSHATDADSATARAVTGQ